MRGLAIGAALLGILVIGGSQPTQAQDAAEGAKSGAPAVQRPARRGEALARRLQLSDEQRAKMRDILNSAREQARKIRTDTSLTPEQKRQQLRELRRNTRQQMGSVLTPEQREKMRKLWAWRWRQWQRWRTWRQMLQPTPLPRGILRGREWRGLWQPRF
ncbi:MAG: hypothetical protein RMM06_10200 [Armatimonadota bacterium]|nr:hypothetical protein [Armatimonadota bacterium]MDW8291088.1 hypothetical protein [Armatimonadota bacterium]